MDSSGCWDYHQSNCWGWQHTYRQIHTYILTMSPALVELISLPRRFLPHRALFPLPHPSAQPWAQPSCNYSLITHTLGGFTQTHTHTDTPADIHAFTHALRRHVWCLNQGALFKAFSESKLLLFLCRVRNVSFSRWIFLSVSMSSAVRSVCKDYGCKSQLTPAKTKSLSLTILLPIASSFPGRQHWLASCLPSYCLTDKCLHCCRGDEFNMCPYSLSACLSKFLPPRLLFSQVHSWFHSVINVCVYFCLTSCPSASYFFVSWSSI